MIRFLILGLLPILAGCATVRTAPVDMNVTNAEGVTYFLPKRDILMTATRTPLVKEEVEKSIKKIEGEIETAKTEIAAQKKLQADAVLRLSNPTISAADQAKYTDQKSFADFVIPKLEADNKAREATKAGLAASLAQHVAGTCQFLYDVKLELQPAAADTSQRFVANLTHSILRDDEQKFVVTQGGLLSSADVTATDRTGDILVEIAGAIGAFGGGPGGVVKAETLDDAQGVPCELTIKTLRYQFDPSVHASITGLNEVLKGGKWPFAVEESAIAAQFLGPDSRQTFFAAGADPDGSGKATRCLRDPIQNSIRYQQLCTPVDGLVYRTAVPAQLILWQCNSQTNCQDSAGSRSNLVKVATPVQSATFLLPQVGPISYVPMRSSAFVKTVDNVVFADGMLTSWTASRPSELLEVVRLPVKLLKSVISVPAEIIKLRVDYSSQTESLSAAYAKQLAAEQQLKKLQECIRQLEASESSDASSCFS